MDGAQRLAAAQWAQAAQHLWDAIAAIEPAARPHSGVALLVEDLRRHARFADGQSEVELLRLVRRTEPEGAAGREGDGA